MIDATNREHHMCRPNNIILIGMPAVGKSTVGVLLAKQTGYGFIDTDLLIQTGEKKRLQQIIQTRGMTQFCDIEAAYIKTLSVQHSVIATGGSVVYRSGAMTHLQTIGTIIFLDIELEPLKQRLGDLDARGVVCPAGQQLADLYKERRPLYQKYAQRTIACSNLTPDALVQALISTIDASADTDI